MPLEPMEQLRAQLGLELSDLLTHRGLRHMKRCCRPCEVAVVSNGYEVLELMKLDAALS